MSTKQKFFANCLAAVAGFALAGCDLATPQSQSTPQPQQLPPCNPQTIALEDDGLGYDPTDTEPDYYIEHEGVLDAVTQATGEPIPQQPIPGTQQPPQQQPVPGQTPGIGQLPDGTFCRF